MIRILFTVCVVCLILTACNPKPVVEVEQEDNEALILLENYEELLEGKLIFKEGHLQGLERILQYFEQDLTENDLENILEIKDFSTYSLTDLLQVMDDKGVFILPTYGETERILAELEEGFPVLATFYPVGSREVDGIFYGYSAEELIYFDIEAQESRHIKLSQLQQAGAGDRVLSLYLSVEDGNAIANLRAKSEFYARLAILEAYYSNNSKLFEQIIPIVEKNNLSESFSYPYAFYYLFIKEDPHKIEDFVLSLNPSQDSLGAELQMKYYQLLGKEDEMKNVVQNIRIDQNLKVETLNEIVRIATILGDEEKAKQATEVLGLKEGS